MMQDILMYTIIYITCGVILALLVTLLLKNQHLLGLNGIEFDGGNKEQFDKLKNRYEKQSLITFSLLVLVLPIFFLIDVINMLIKFIKLVYNSLVGKIVKLFKGKK